MSAVQKCFDSDGRALIPLSLMKLSSLQFGGKKAICASSFTNVVEVKNIDDVNDADEVIAIVTMDSKRRLALSKIFKQYSRYTVYLKETRVFIRLLP